MRERERERDPTSPAKWCKFKLEFLSISYFYSAATLKSQLTVVALHTVIGSRGGCLIFNNKPTPDIFLAGPVGSICSYKSLDNCALVMCFVVVSLWFCGLWLFLCCVVLQVRGLTWSSLVSSNFNINVSIYIGIGIRLTIRGVEIVVRVLFEIYILLIFCLCDSSLRNFNMST